MKARTQRPRGQRERSDPPAVPGRCGAGRGGGRGARPGRCCSRRPHGRPAIPTIRIPNEIPAALGEAPFVGSFEGNGMTGADVFAQLCKNEGLAAMFCCPGNYTVTHAIAAAGVPSYGGRTEGNMAAAADGYARATGEVVACSGTEGPGFTNMITSIASAYFARMPLLVLASNVQLSGEDREAGIQTMYQQPITEGIKKYGKRMILPNRVHEYGAYAFRQLKTGVPGPVHLDFPGEVARARFTDPATLTDYYESSRYRTESRAVPAPKDVAKAVDLITKAERPLVVAGHGVFHRKAWDALRTAAEKNDLAVVTTGPMRGHFPDDHRLSASLSPRAMMSADLLIFVGQYLHAEPERVPRQSRRPRDPRASRRAGISDATGRSNWASSATSSRSSRRWPAACRSGERDAWVAEVAAARKTYEAGADAQLPERSEVQRRHRRAASVGHRQRAQRLPLQGQDRSEADVDRLGRLLVAADDGAVCSGPIGPARKSCARISSARSGPDLAMMIGAAMAVKDGVGPQQPYKGAPSVCLTTDAGMGFTLIELDTAVKYKVPLITVVYNNNCWGTWTSTAGSPRSVHLHLFQENIRYDRIAEALGAHGAYVRTPEELRAALQRAATTWRRKKGCRRSSTSRRRRNSARRASTRPVAGWASSRASPASSIEAAARA